MSTASPAVLYGTAKSSNVQEDHLVRDIFDSRDVWRSFNSTKSTPTGLFQNKYLTHPDGFKTFSDKTLSRARRLVDDISQGKRQDTIIKDLDRLSDMLCSVSDLTAFIRTSHPDREFVEKANETFSDVLEYMNGLNQHEKLYELTAQATAHSTEEEAVQKGLLHDFEQSGMILPPGARDEFVSLSSECIALEQRFVGNTAPAEPYIEFSVDELRGLHQSDLRAISNGRKARLPTGGNISQKALILVESEDVRRRIWEAQHTGRQDQIQILERLFRIRGKLALLTRHKTYAEAQLVDKMAKTPGTSCMVKLT
jgi:intermediate peptidase